MFSRDHFVALTNRNFRLLWIGLLASLTGSMMQNAALLWHVSLLVSPERKALALGLVGLVRFVPIVIFSMISGVVADVWNRRRLMLLTQTGVASISLGLAVLAFRGLSAVWPLFVLTTIGASISTFDMPARQALVPTLVPREHLPNAISLNAMMFQTASVVGPSLGGIVIWAGGVGWVYLLNTLSFGCVIAALLMMRGVSGIPVREAHDPEHEVSWRAAMEGLQFVFRAPLIRSTMLLDFVATFFSSATALLPIFAQDILQVGAKGYGWLYAAPAVGAVAMSAAMIPLTGRIRRRGPVLLWAIGGYGLATAVFGVSRWFWLTFFCLAVTGAMDTISMIIRNIVRQLETPDRLRGRMIGVNMVFFQGGPQLGELEAGFVANWLGPVFSVVSGGVGCLIATAWVAATTPALRHYRAESVERATASVKIRPKSPDPV
ncbi:MAG TPA: MFS transporter [Vicinamibacterales bacterium]|nr:MFS transporter [Vicinamibacterales bacterium]